MKLKNVLVTVSDMERSKKFYRELFGLNVILDQEGNAILTEGLVLQDIKIWENCIEKSVVKYNHAAGLYFEEADMDAFMEKLSHYSEPIRYVNQLPIRGQKVVRLYDPDGNLIEVAAPVLLQ